MKEKKDKNFGFDRKVKQVSSIIFAENQGLRSRIAAKTLSFKCDLCRRIPDNLINQCDIKQSRAPH